MFVSEAIICCKLNTDACYSCRAKECCHEIRYRLSTKPKFLVTRLRQYGKTEDEVKAFLQRQYPSYDFPLKELI